MGSCLETKTSYTVSFCISGAEVLHVAPWAHVQTGICHHTGTHQMW